MHTKTLHFHSPSSKFLVSQLISFYIEIILVIVVFNTLSFILIFKWLTHHHIRIFWLWPYIYLYYCCIFSCFFMLLVSFISISRTPFSLSCKAGLAAMDSLSFCLSRKDFISLISGRWFCWIMYSPMPWKYLVLLSSQLY